jgi:hypothetical protein
VKHDRLLSWWSAKFGRLTATQLRQSFEHVSADELQAPYYDALVAFRHLTQKARQQACESFLRRKVEVRV